MFTELPLMDILGWGGAAGLGLFYWFLGSGKVLKAYVFGTIGALAWLIVGVLTHHGYAAELPSLIGTEALVLVMNIRGIYRWKKGLN